jgi:hypothetical protein
MVRNHHTNGQRIRVIKKNSEFRQRISIKLSYTEPSENCLSELSQKNARLMTSAAGKPEEKPEDVVDWGDDDSGTNSLTVPSKTASPMTVSSKAYYDQDERGNSLPTASYKNLRRDFQDTSKELLREIFEKPNLLSKLGLVKTDDSVDTLLLVSGQEVRIQIQVIGMLNTGETNTNTTYPDNRDTPSEMSWEPTYRGVSNRPCKFINTAKGCLKGDGCRYSHLHQDWFRRQECPKSFNCPFKHNDDWRYWDHGMGRSYGRLPPHARRSHYTSRPHELFHG